MIQRYSRPEVSGLWTEKAKYFRWLRVERAVCEALAEEGVLPKEEWLKLDEALLRLEKEGGVDPERVEEIEKVTRHDVIAFSTAVTERVGDPARYFHYGLTSSDVIDTALALTLQEVGQVLLKSLERVLDACRDRSEEFRSLPTIGRSHGIFAEPTSFGLKFLSWRQELIRNRRRLEASLKGLRVGKLSGAVGVSPHWAPSFESRVLAKLGLRREPVATQVMPRDRHAEFFTAMALTGSCIERIAVELRHLQRSEVSEAREGFSTGQKGSSAMPHKRNPISSENLTGCSRLLRAYAQAALEDIALWHERDISHSSVERVALPDATILLDYALNRLADVLVALEVDPKKIGENLERAGDTIFSGHILLELIREGVAREDGYAWIQECALGSIDGKGSFEALLSGHKEVKKRISRARIKELCSLKHQLRHVDAIYHACEKDTE